MSRYAPSAGPPGRRVRRESRHGTRDTSSDRIWRAGVTVVVLILAGLTAWAILSFGMSRATTIQAPAPPPEVAQAYAGTVSEVVGPADVQVLVSGRIERVRVLGLSPASGTGCGASEAQRHAREVLDGQRVTLVPDPTLEAQREPDGRLRAYVVLADQLSYTDDAIRDGVARQDPDLDTWYGPVFDREERAAATAGLGLWRPAAEGGCWSADR